jgi:hypothetical protein
MRYVFDPDRVVFFALNKKGLRRKRTEQILRGDPEGVLNTPAQVSVAPESDAADLRSGRVIISESLHTDNRRSVAP